jgi:hypothetical protein
MIPSSWGVQHAAAFNSARLLSAAEVQEEESVQESHVADVGFVIAAGSERQKQ